MKNKGKNVELLQKVKKRTTIRINLKREKVKS